MINIKDILINLTDSINHFTELIKMIYVELVNENIQLKLQVKELNCQIKMLQNKFILIEKIITFSEKIAKQEILSNNTNDDDFIFLSEKAKLKRK